MKSEHVPELVIYKLSWTLLYLFENERDTKETSHSELLVINLNDIVNNYSKTHPKG